MVEDFDVSNGYGQKGEELVRTYGKLMAAGETLCEVKRKSYRDWKFYVEVEQTSKHGNGPIVPSGIHSTDAPLFAFVLADTGIVIVLPTELLREVVESLGKPVTQPQLHQGNPTRGVLLDLAQILRRYAPDSSGWPVPAGGWKETEEIT